MVETDDWKDDAIKDRLHHYDAIGLLSPSQRTGGGARLYGRDDLIRLQRIEALKQFGFRRPVPLGNPSNA